MSFVVKSGVAPRSFSTRSASGTAMPSGPARFSSGSAFGGAGGMSSRISVANVRDLADKLRPHVQLNNMTLMSPTNDKEAMKGLNDRLADYLSKVRLLEESNNKLERQIKEELMKKGTANDRDWSAYEKQLDDLRKQVKEMTMDNARLLLQIDNARLAADDFKLKFETEQAMRVGTEQDITGLRKHIDDTHLSRMQLESQLEALREELLYLRKNHEEDVASLRSQISESNVSVEMETAKGADLSEIISNIRLQYEKAAQQNQADTEAWYQTKFDNIAAEVSQNTEALQGSKTELNDLRRQRQSLEIELQSLRKMVEALQDTLDETGNRYAQDVNTLNNRIVQLEAELGQVRAQVERQAADYQALLNVKVRLEGEIATYHSLLDGGSTPDDRVEFSLEQALSAVPERKVKKAVIISQEVVDGEVVSQSELEVNPVHGPEEEEDWEETAAPEEKTEEDVGGEDEEPSQDTAE